MQAESRSTSSVPSSFKDLKLLSLRSPHQPQPAVPPQKRTQSKKVVIRGDSLQDDKFHENFERLARAKTALDVAFIESCLAKHFVFRELAGDSELLADIIAKFFCCAVGQGEFIMRQGGDASSFFILEKGRFSVIINGERRREIREGEGFGELALLYSAPRSASLQAAEPCTLWGIDRSSFRRAVSEVCDRQYTENRGFIDKAKFFEYLTARQKDLVANILIQHRYHAGEKIVREGDPASSFYLLKEGEARAVCRGVPAAAALLPGTHFGEEALISESRLREATVEAVGECTVLALGRDSLKGILGESLPVIVYRNKISASVASSPILGQLDRLSLERFIDSLQIGWVAGGQPIVAAGVRCRDKIFFVLEGTLEKSPHSIDVEDSEVFFGERAIQSAHAELTFPEVRLQGEGRVAYTSYAKLVEAIGGTYEQVVAKQQKLNAALATQAEQTHAFKQRASQIPLEELSIVKKLGCGQFGVVYLASHKGELYALKCIEKCQIIECKLERQLRDEKQVLSACSHPFLLQYARSYRDERFVYFLTEFINGLELFDVIREIGLLSPKDARFYVASLLLALEYLHANEIIYRDLKPENIIVGARGYLKLIDMGTCKLMRGKKCGSRTFTIIGTPQYMAPEVLAAKGYCASVDLWSLGVCFYEFVCGYVPFGEEVDDPYEIYEEILNKELEFPTYLVDAAAKALLTQLLCKKQEIRLGGSFSALKSHPWFAHFEWDLLLSEKLPPPYTVPAPKLTDAKEALGRKGRTITRELEETLPRKKARPLPSTYDKLWDLAF